MPKPPRIDSRRKRFSRRKLTALVILVVAAATVVSFVSYGLAFGGIVDFTFGAKNDLRQSYQLTAMSEFRPSTIDISHIIIRNTGRTGITVIVTIHALNAVVSLGYYGPYSDSANTQIYLSPGSGYRVVNFYLTLPLQVPTFTISVTAGRVLDFSSIPSLATSSLASIQPTTPTTLVYTQENTSSVNYQLSEQY